MNDHLKSRIRFHSTPVKSLIFFFLLLCLPLSAAGPVTHAYLAKRFLYHFPKYNEQQQTEFMIGTLFPDIRYLGHIERSETHYDQMPLHKVLRESSAFQAGVKFHSYVDLVRDQFIRTTYKPLHNQELSKSEFRLYLKLIEDQILYNFYNWQDCCDGLEIIYPEETAYKIDEATILKWHSLMKVSFTYPPHKVLLFLSIAQNNPFNISQEYVDGWKETLPRDSERLKSYVADLVKHFEKEMFKFSSE